MTPADPLPSTVLSEVEEALRARGGLRVTRTRAVAGGCINRGVRLDVEPDLRFFLKWNAETGIDLFDAEADGLAALARRTPLRIPEPIALGGGAAGPAWLLMEWIERGPEGPQYGPRLGEGLAALHAGSGPVVPGWERDNWIGALPQANTLSADWGTFWRDRRIEPQLRRARVDGRLRDSDFDRLIELIPAALANTPVDGMLHGDLWSGNVFPDTDGRPVLIDPAVYHGAGEVDLAMIELFGGFPRDTLAAYNAVRTISSEYTAFGRDLYQLYYLLVHVNLFGGSYETATRQAARRVLHELG